MSRRVPPPPAFLPLVAAYPVLYLATANPGQTEWFVVVGMALASATAAMLVYWLLTLVARSPSGAAVGTGLIVLMFYVYGQVSSWADAFAMSLRLGNDQTPNVLDLAPQGRLLLALAWTVLGLAGGLLLARSDRAAGPRLGRAINVAAVALYGMLLVTVVGSREKGAALDPAPESFAEKAPGTTGDAPDVYFIVLDGYARADVLTRYYGSDNAPFLDALRGRGFRVAQASSANYNWTFLSLASTLNLGYLHELFESGIGENISDVSLLYESIRNSLTARFLRSRGYRIVHFQSTWGATARNPYADRQVRCEFSAYNDEFFRALAEATLLGAFHSKAGVDLARCHQANFTTLAAMGTEPGPKFVFAHFVLPHHPYLFDRAGNVLRNAVVSNQFEFQRKLWEDRASYLAQLEYVNSLVLEAVNGILKSSSVPPVIVIESDHGPGLIEGLTPEDQVALRLASLGAYYLPGAPPDLLPDGSSAVNQFRAILSHYFGASLPPLQDRYFVSPFGRPYAFKEVPRTLLVDSWTRIAAGANDPAVIESVVTGEETDDESKL